MKARHRLIGQSALQAYQSDIPLGGAEPTKQDQATILVATLLRQSLSAGDSAVTERMTAEAVKIARESLGPVALAQGCTYDDHPAESRADTIRLLAQHASHAGRMNLAQHLLESLAEIEEDALDKGRVLGDRSRISRQLGHLDLSAEQANELLRTGRRIRQPELVAIALQQLGAVAESRGNGVEFRERVERMLRLTKAANLRKRQASAHAGLGTSFAKQGQYGKAVDHFWQAYRLSDQSGQVAREVLANLAQTLLVSGHPIEARKIATIVLQQSPPLLAALPALGCFALASANVGDIDGVTWSCTQVRKLAKSRHHAREVAEAMIECSAALAAIGESAQAGVLKRRGESLAGRYGFHDLTFEEAMLSARSGARPQLQFHGRAAGAAAEIVEMELPQIPGDLHPLLV